MAIFRLKPSCQSTAHSKNSTCTHTYKQSRSDQPQIPLQLLRTSLVFANTINSLTEPYLCCHPQCLVWTKEPTWSQCLHWTRMIEFSGTIQTESGREVSILSHYLVTFRGSSKVDFAFSSATTLEPTDTGEKIFSKQTCLPSPTYLLYKCKEFMIHLSYLVLELILCKPTISI